MDNRYKEVLMTYLRRPFSSWRATAWLVFAVWAVTRGSAIRKNGVAFHPLFLGTFTLAFLLWLHFREQAASVHRLLTPRFVMPHIAVFLLLGLFVSTTCCLFTVSSGQYGMLPAFAVATVIFAIAGSYIATGSLLGLVLLLAPFCWGISGKPSPLHSLLIGGYPRESEGLLGLGYVTIILLTRWLTIRTEESWAYTRQNRLEKLFSHLQRLTPGFRTLPGRYNPDNSSRKLYKEPPGRNALTGKGGELLPALRRWHAAGFIRPVAILAASLVVVLPVVLALSSGRRAVEFTARIDLPIAFLFPAMFGRRWLAFWLAMETESLRPLSRQRFVRSIGIAICAQVALAGFIAGTALAVVVVAGGGVVALQWVGPFFAAAILAQPLICGIFWGGLQHKALHSGLTWPLFAISVLVGIQLFPEAGPANVIAFAAAIAVAGLVLIMVVYRHWMNAEMG